MNKSVNILLAIFMCSAWILSCKKDGFNTSQDARINVSVDSIRFDTVFTNAGSVTQSFKIFNSNNQKLLLSNVKLMGGPASSFKININGQAASEVNDIEIAANDSIYVFVSVFIDPNTSNQPFIVSDSIQISYNNNNRFVQLEAFGQNARYLRNELISGNQTWTNGIPYVILGGIRIDTSAILQINAGCRIYLHADAAFLVDGTLTVLGEKNNEVLFTGDRLDPYYRDLPGSWPGLYFNESSKDNLIQFAIIKNAYQAVVVLEASRNNNPKLVLRQSVISNAFDAGIIGFKTSIAANNSLISNCGRNIQLLGGGDYAFIHCTSAAFSNAFIAHNKPVLAISNYAVQNGAIISNDLNAVFQNSIFWGSPGLVSDEAITDKQGNNVFNVVFDHCLYRAENDPANSTLNNIIRNIDPVFDSIDVFNRYYDFRINSFFAPGTDQGMPTAFSKDLDDLPRSIGLPDLGCYEKQ